MTPRFYYRLRRFCESTAGAVVLGLLTCPLLYGLFMAFCYALVHSPSIQP